MVGWVVPEGSWSALFQCTEGGEAPRKDRGGHSCLLAGSEKSRSALQRTLALISEQNQKSTGPAPSNQQPTKVT